MSGRSENAQRVLLTSEQIGARVREMGAQIDADYPAGTLILVCILKGACFFLADLARAIRREVFIDFIGTSSYGKSKTSSGEVQLTKDLDGTVDGAEGEPADATVSGPAWDLDLWLWGRGPLDGLTVTGDRAVVDRFRALVAEGTQ